MAVGLWAIQPSEFWRMTPREWWWIYDAKVGKPKQGDRLTAEEVQRYTRMLEEG